MTVAEASSAYALARAALERAAAELQAALESELAQLTEQLPAELRAVAAAVAAEFGLEQADLLGRNKRRDLVEARFALMAIAQQACPRYTSVKLAACFGRDHAMVSYSAAAMRRLCDSDPRYRARITRIRLALRGLQGARR